MGIVFFWNWPVEVFVLLGVALVFVLAVILAFMVLVYLFHVIKYAVLRFNAAKHLRPLQKELEGCRMVSAWHLYDVLEVAERNDIKLTQEKAVALTPLDILSKDYDDGDDSLMREYVQEMQEAFSDEQAAREKRNSKRDELDYEYLKEVNAFTYSWYEVVDAGWSGTGKIFAWIGAVFVVVLYALGALMADRIVWKDHIDATIGRQYDVVSMDHFHRTIVVDEGGCYVTFPEHAYSDVLERFIGSGKADMSRVDYDWEGTPKQPCLPIRSE